MVEVTDGEEGGGMVVVYILYGDVRHVVIQYVFQHGFENI